MSVSPVTAVFKPDMPVGHTGVFKTEENVTQAMCDLRDLAHEPTHQNMRFGNVEFQLVKVAFIQDEGKGLQERLHRESEAMQRTVDRRVAARHVDRRSSPHPIARHSLPSVVPKVARLVPVPSGDLGKGLAQAS